MANSNRKKTRKLHEAKQAKKAEDTKKEKSVRKAKADIEKPIKYTVTAEQLDDGTFKFNGGKSVFNITMQKNKALEPYGKCIHNYGVLLELIPGDKQTAINQQIGNARVVHNDYLSKRIDYYKESKETLTVSKYKKDYLQSGILNSNLSYFDKFPAQMEQMYNHSWNMYPLPENTESCLLVFHHGFQKSPGIFRFLLLHGPAFLCHKV